MTICDMILASLERSLKASVLAPEVTEQPPAEKAAPTATGFAIAMETFNEWTDALLAHLEEIGVQPTRRR